MSAMRELVMVKTIKEDSTSLMLKRLVSGTQAVKPCVEPVADELPEAPKTSPDMQHILSQCLNQSNQHNEKLGS
jgi:hypothetical protein